MTERGIFPPHVPLNVPLGWFEFGETTRLQCSLDDLRTWANDYHRRLTAAEGTRPKAAEQEKKQC